MPEIPELPILNEAGPSYMVVKGNEKNEVVMEFLEAVHDLYAEEKLILTSAYQERLKNNIIRRQRDEEVRQNPPPKPDMIINYWKKKTTLDGKEVK